MQDRHLSHRMRVLRLPASESALTALHVDQARCVHVLTTEREGFSGPETCLGHRLHERGEVRVYGPRSPEDRPELGGRERLLQPMGPALLVQCDNAIELGKRLVTEWLTRFMFKGVADGPARAKAAADYLATHGNFNSHARPVQIEHLSSFGLSLINLRTQAPLFARVWEAYCVMDLIFANTPIYKIFYNSMHEAMVRQIPQQIVLPGLPFQPGQPPPGPQQPPAPQPGPTPAPHP